MAEILAEFLKKEYKPEAHIIGRGILPVRGKCIVGGAPKSNKSFLMLNGALDLCRGRRLFDASYKNGSAVMPVNKPWRVLYLDMELGEQGALERLKGKDGRPGLVTDVQPDGLELYIQTRDTAMRLDTPQGRDFIEQVVKAIRPDVTIFDPLAKFHLADENSSQETGALMRVVDHLIEDYGTSAIVVHHLGKLDPDPSKQKRGGDRLRGSSALFADTDTLIEVSRLSSEHTLEPILKLTFELRRGEPIEDLFVQRHRDGSVTWMGEGYSFDDPKKDYWPKGKYRSL